MCNPPYALPYIVMTMLSTNQKDIQIHPIREEFKLLPSATFLTSSFVCSSSNFSGQSPPSSSTSTSSSFPPLSSPSTAVDPLRMPLLPSLSKTTAALSPCTTHTFDSFRLSSSSSDEYSSRRLLLPAPPPASFCSSPPQQAEDGDCVCLSVRTELGTRSTSRGAKNGKEKDHILKDYQETV
eukprot:GHVS01085944.1.p1 GENE.GHVS01085944.1~~GHVS01085944.1.p1  ORF type:complete len:181 (-),score=45.94 GHVS01085944.1:68-610(-)